MRQAAFLLAALLVASPANAGPRDAEIEAMIDKAVAEWTAPLVCSGFEAEGYRNINAIWKEERAKMVPQLIRLKVAPDVLRRIGAKTDPSTITAMLDKPAREVSAWCLMQKDWLTRVYTFNLTYFGQKLSQMPLE